MKNEKLAKIKVAIFFSLIFIFSSILISAQSGRKASVRVGVWDKTEIKPIHKKAEIWIRGSGSWFLKQALAEGKPAKTFGTFPIGYEQEFIFYPDGRKGVELTIPFKITTDMNPNGSYRSTLRIEFYDDIILISGPPITSTLWASEERKIKRQ